MRFRNLSLAATFLAASALAVVPCAPAAFAQRATQPRAQSEGTAYQRLQVLTSRLESVRRTLNNATAGLNAGGDKKKKDKQPLTAADEAGVRLRGLDKEVGAQLSDVADLRGKQDRGEKYDPTQIEKLETAFAELNERVDAALKATAGERRNTPAAASASTTGQKKKKAGFFGRILGRGGDSDEYAELVNGSAPGRDRQLFGEAAKLARKGNYEGARSLFNVVINTYPDSPFLPHAKLAIADTFYLEGATSALIQSAAAYQEWLTFFPTDPLSDEVMLKIAEVEMRQMGLPDRDVAHAKKAEQRLKVLLQQFPKTSLRPDAELRLREVQENLGMHGFEVGNFYYEKWSRGAMNSPKGAQSRYAEVAKNYPNFSRLDEVLYRLGATYIAEEEPDEAAKYFQRVVRDFPNSSLAEKAKEQLDAIGAAKPEADKQALAKLPPERPGMMGKVLTEVLGRVDITVDDNGVMIHKDAKGGDLLDQVIATDGNLPVTTPTAPVSSTRIPRRAAAAPPPTPVPAKTDTEADKGGLKLQPTRNGAPATGDNPTAPAPATPPNNGVIKP